MINRSIRIFAERHPMHIGEIALHIGEFDQSGKLTGRVNNITLERVKEDGDFCAQTTDQSLLIDATAAQQLMDELWRCGVRPAETRHQSDAPAAT